MKVMCRDIQLGVASAPMAMDDAGLDRWSRSTTTGSASSSAPT